MSRQVFGWSVVVAMLAGSTPSSEAQAPPQEAALARAAGDAQLQWGACPPFLPAGCGIAVLHGDPAKSNADIFLRIPGKAVLPEHSHTSAERMVLVEGELRVTYKGQPEAILKPGMYAYGPAGMPHKGTCASSDPCILFIAFESPVDAVPVQKESR